MKLLGFWDVHTARKADEKYRQMLDYHFMIIVNLRGIIVICNFLPNQKGHGFMKTTLMFMINTPLVADGSTIFWRHFETLASLFEKYASSSPTLTLNGQSQSHKSLGSGCLLCRRYLTFTFTDFDSLRSACQMSKSRQKMRGRFKQAR